MKCVIIEDEQPTLDELKFLLERYQWVEVMGCSKDGVSGLDMIKELEPDVVFLDIQMPGLSGVELANQLRFLDKKPWVIFTTAFQEHAVKAFELGAVDYLLKPYDENRIHMALERLRKRLDAQEESKVETTQEQNLHLERLPVVLGSKTVLIESSLLSYCLSENQTVYLHTDQQTYQCGYTLQELMKRTSLFRIHKSCLVNLKRIHEVYPWFNGTYQVVLDDPEKTELVVSRSYVKGFKKAIGL